MPVILTGTFHISAGHLDFQPDNDRMTGDFAHHWEQLVKCSSFMCDSLSAVKIINKWLIIFNQIKYKTEKTFFILNIINAPVFFLFYILKFAWYNTKLIEMYTFKWFVIRAKTWNSNINIQICCHYEHWFVIILGVFRWKSSCKWFVNDFDIFQ